MIIISQKIAEWGDSNTPPEYNTTCANWYTIPGFNTQICTQWVTKSRHLEVEAFLEINGPDNATAEAKQAISTCVQSAVAAICSVGVTTNGASAAAQTILVACLKANSIQDAEKYSATVKTSTNWTDWA